MAGPLTWRNIESGAGVLGAARLMETAGNQVNTGFEIGLRALQDNKDQQIDNYKQETQFNTEQFKNALSGLKTVKDVEAFEANGGLEALKAQYANAPIDQDTLRSGAENRMLNLRNAEIADFEHGTIAAKQESQPAYQALLASIYGNDDAARDANLAANQDIFAKAGLTGEVAQLAAGQDRQEVQDSRAAESHANSLAASTLSQQSSRMNIAAQEKSLAIEQQSEELALLTNSLVNSGADENLVRQQLNAHALKNGYSDKAIQPVIASVPARIEANFGLTTPQQQALALETQKTLAANTASAQADAERLAVVQAQNPLVDVPAFDEKIQRGAVVETLTKAGWDQNTGLGDNPISEHLESVTKIVNDTYPGIEKNPMYDFMLNEAAKSLGSGDNPGYVFDTNRNINEKTLARATMDLIANYKRNEESQLKILETTQSIRNNELTRQNALVDVNTMFKTDVVKQNQAERRKILQRNGLLGVDSSELPPNIRR